MSYRRVTGGLFSIVLVAVLAGCTPAVSEFWLVTDEGDMSFASCDQFTIDTLLVSTRARSDDGSQVVVQQFELSGPEMFFDDGESFDLAAVAAGWSAPEQLDMSTDWYEVTLEGSNNGNQSLFSSAERAELPVGEWIQLPQPGLGVVACDRT
jgi:hypothetical protein